MDALSIAIGCLVGMFIGASVGVLFMAVLQAGAMADRQSDEAHERWIAERMAD